jgi:hypothetical protein
VRSEDAAALRVISDQLEERGDDAGAACLRDIAGRMESTAKPWFIDWPEELGVGELRITGVEVRVDQPIRDAARYDYLGYLGPSPQYRLLIEAEPIGVWIVRQVDKPDGRVSYLR